MQAKNFKPDLAAENPWGDLVVTASQIEKGNLLKAVEPAGEELQEMEGSPCSITADQEKGLVLEEGTFFSHIMLLPGDSHRESLQLSNRETRRIQILMKAEWEKSSFLDQMQLQICRQSLSAKQRRYPLVLCHKAGEKRRISCDGKCRTLFTLCSNLLRSSDSRGLVSEKETVR